MQKGRRTMANDYELPSDHALVTAAEDGDEHAFTTLYERHAPSAWRFGLGLTGDPQAAGAAVTEAFARTFTTIRAGRCPVDTSVHSLLLTTVRHVVLDQRDTDDTAADTRFAYADGDAAAVAAAFAPLPERWRSVLWLTDVEDMRPSRIAPIVGLASRATALLATRAHAGLIEQYLRADVATTGSRNCQRAVARLGSYVAGTLPPSDAEKLERHIDLCDACRRRRSYLYILGSQLRLLALPLPAELADETRAAWAAAVVTAEHSGTGLSSTAEKVLAGVSAFAAAVGVLGATMFNPSHRSADAESAMPVSPAANETVEPPAPVTAPVDLPAAATSGTPSGVARHTSSGLPRSGNGVVGTSSPGATTATTDLQQPADPRADTPSSSPSSTTTSTTTPADSGNDPVAATSPDAPVSVGTTVADTPVAVDVGSDPGVTVGSVSTGSEPTPDDGSTASVSGPLEPLAPVVAPIDDTVTEVTGTLGL